MEVLAWAAGRLAPSTFPPTRTGGIAHLGSRRLPRMRYLADEITAAATRKALCKACKTRALVRDSTCIERGLAPPITICHARTPDRRVARANERDARAASRQQPRQRSGGLRGQTERLSAHAGSTQIVGSSQQSGGVRWPPVVAGTQAEVRSGEGKGGGSPARAGRCALRCGRCGKEPSPRCVGRGFALPGPLLW